MMTQLSKESTRLKIVAKFVAEVLIEVLFSLSEQVKPDESGEPRTNNVGRQTNPENELLFDTEYIDDEESPHPIGVTKSKKVGVALLVSIIDASPEHVWTTKELGATMGISPKNVWDLLKLVETQFNIFRTGNHLSILSRRICPGHCDMCPKNDVCKNTFRGQV